MELIHELRKALESEVCGYSEVSPSIHIVYVGPENVQREVELFVVFVDVNHFLGAVVAVFALMPAKSPERR